MKSVPIITLASAFLAIAAWGGVVWFALHITQLQASVTAMREEQVTLYTREDYTNTLRALARDTVDEREILAEKTANFEAVEVIQLLESTSDAAGTSLIIESVGSQEHKTQTGSMQAIVANLRAEGSFQDVFQFLSLVETLPIATVIQSVSMDQREGESGAWAGLIRVLVLTDAANL